MLPVQKRPLFQSLGGNEAVTLPAPMMNILNGGSHADNNVDIQEFMVFPIGASSFSQALQMGTETFHHLKSVLKSKGLNTSVGDEGGFAPTLSSNEEAIEVILEAIERTGYTAGKDISLAIDTAASEIYRDGLYHLDSEGRSLSSNEMVDYYSKLIDKYPIVSIEDGLAEDDWSGWKQMNAELGHKIQIVGDDLTVTNMTRLQRAIDEKSMNAILIKLNQIGTVSETIDAVNLAKEIIMVSLFLIVPERRKIPPSPILLWQWGWGKLKQVLHPEQTGFVNTTSYCVLKKYLTTQPFSRERRFWGNHEPVFFHAAKAKKRRPSQAVEIQKTLVRSILIIGAIVLIIIFFLGDHGVYQLYRLRKEKNEIQQQIVEMREEKQKLEAEKTRLETDF